ncbi:MAG: hypothetical protein GY710_06390 [Desulfobacteraceae bacterium]|nr:hypothetical protein [Desulfobacteraceae bacterium]
MSLALAGLAVMGGSSILNFFNGMEQAKTQRKITQKRVASFDNEIALTKENLVIQDHMYWDDYNEFYGSQEGAIVSAGVQAGVGSAEYLLQANNVKATLDADLLMREGMSKITALESSREIARAGGEATFQAQQQRAFGELLSGGGQVAFGASKI